MVYSSEATCCFASDGINGSNILQDNVFVQIHCSIQYRVIKENADDAFYELQNPKDQIQAYVFDGNISTSCKIPYIWIIHNLCFTFSVSSNATSSCFSSCSSSYSQNEFGWGFWAEEWSCSGCIGGTREGTCICLELSISQWFSFFTKWRFVLLSNEI